MRAWFVPFAVGLALAGCDAPPSGSSEPMPTDGPNQVVLKVPDMT
jgi:hypothetical protein